MLIGKLLSPFITIGMRIISICIYIVTIIAAFGGRVNPDFLTFPAVLCLAFPYLVILTLALVLYWGVRRKLAFCAFGILTLFCCLNPLSEAFPLGKSRTPDPGHKTFKVLAWNVLHTNDIREPNYEGNRAVEYMLGSGADIIGLIELKDFSSRELKNLSPQVSDSLLKVYPYRAGITGEDIKIMAKYPVERIDFDQSNNYDSKRFEVFKVQFPENKTVIVILVHLYSYSLSEEERAVVTDINSIESAKSSMNEFRGPIRGKLSNAFRQRAFNAENLRSVIDDISPDIPLIVCGDFNDVPSSWTYNIIRGDDLRDAYAETNFGPAITYNLHAFYFHIDQMLYRGPIEALDLKVGKINSSDHYPLTGEFEFLSR